MAALARDLLLASFQRTLRWVNRLDWGWIWPWPYCPVFYFFAAISVSWATANVRARWYHWGLDLQSPACFSFWLSASFRSAGLSVKNWRWGSTPFRLIFKGCRKGDKDDWTCCLLLRGASAIPWSGIRSWGRWPWLISGFWCRGWAGSWGWRSESAWVFEFWGFWSWRREDFAGFWEFYACLWRLLWDSWEITFIEVLKEQESRLLRE